MELAVPRSVSVRHAGGMTQSEVTKDTTNSDDPSAVVRRFFESWSGSKAAALASFDEFFTPDTVWENVGLATTVGIDEARALAENSPPGFETMIAEFKLLVADGPYVFSERVDDFYNAAGELLVSARGAGVAEVRAGRIVAMREYFILTENPTTPDAPATDE
jgi:limonene-1,2-epoxide hydrolase